MFPADLFKDKVAFITGGGSGLGKAIAVHLVRHGGKAVIVGRRMEVLRSTAEEIGSEHVLAVPCDVRFSEDVEQATAAALERFGQVDFLINNAAGNFVYPTERLSANAFRLIIDTVLMGAVHCTLTLGKHWIETGRSGSVLCIVTNYASTGSAYVVPSGCAKAGVENMIKSLAAEWGRHRIRFVGISPGPFPTEGAMGQLRLNEDLLPGVDIPRFVAQRIPLGRMGRPQELADLALFLLSPQAEFINGEIIRIDGGEVPNLAGEFCFMHAVEPDRWNGEASRLNRRKAGPVKSNEPGDS